MLWYYGINFYQTFEEPQVFFCFGLLWILHDVDEEIDWAIEDYKDVWECWEDTEPTTFPQFSVDF